MDKATVIQHLDKNKLKLQQAQSSRNFSEVWAILKPVLVYASSFWLLGKKVKSALKILIAAIDTYLAENN